MKEISDYIYSAAYPQNPTKTNNTQGPGIYRRA